MMLVHLDITNPHNERVYTEFSKIQEPNMTETKTQDDEEKKLDTVVKCHDCGKEEQVNFLHAMQKGWPYCCKEGMHLHDTTANVQEDIKKLTGWRAFRSWNVKR